MNENKYGKPVRLKQKTLALLDQLIEKANQKEIGQKIKTDDIIFLGLKAVTDRSIKKLQSSSLTNEDKKNYLFQKYLKENPNATIDEFTGFMMSANFQKFLKQHNDFESLV